MGYDAYAVAVIGVKHAPGVIKSKLFQEVTRRVCDHPMEEGMKHCPECGAPRTTTFPVPISEYVDEEGDGDTLCGYALEYRSSEDDDPEFIAWWSSGHVRRLETTSLGSRENMDFSQAREEMCAKLEPLGLWNEHTFGLHVFLYESC